MKPAAYLLKAFFTLRNAPGIPGIPRIFNIWKENNKNKNKFPSGYLSVKWMEIKFGNKYENVREL